MKKELKTRVVETLVDLVKQYGNFYLTDVEGMPADKTSRLRREAFKRDVKMVVVKNTMLKLALEQVDADAFTPLFDTLKGNTAVMFSETANAPARLIKEFTKDDLKAAAKTGAKVVPALKSAYVQESLFIGANQLDALVNVKSKEELIGDVILMLQSPITDVISALDGAAGGTIHGLLKSMEERNA